MINKTCPLILRDVILYDIESCYPTILNQQNYDFQDVDLSDKVERNIFLGKKQIGNENLSSYLIESANQLLNFYLQENEVSDEQIIVTQRDGFIITKHMGNCDEFIPIKLREHISLLILGIDRKKFLYTTDLGDVVVKGITFYYDALDVIFQQFSNLDLYNKRRLFLQLESIKSSILDSSDKKLFLIPTRNDKYAVITYKGNLEVKDPDYIDIDQINKTKYYEHYVRDFLRSLYLQFYV